MGDPYVVCAISFLPLQKNKAVQSLNTRKGARFQHIPAVGGVVELGREADLVLVRDDFHFDALYAGLNFVCRRPLLFTPAATTAMGEDTRALNAGLAAIRVPLVDSGVLEPVADVNVNLLQLRELGPIPQALGARPAHEHGVVA
jgi:hypothetical protein